MADLSFLNGLYGIRTPQDYGAQQPDEQSSLEAQVLALINSLEPSAQPIAPSQPQQPSMGQRVFGGIGDALTSMASVRAGGGPIATGPFAARQQVQQKSYEEQLLDYQRRQEENAAADRTLRNTVRIGASQEAMRAKREKANAEAKAQGRRLRFIPQTIDVNGTSTRVIEVFDPATNEYLGRHESGEAGYAPFVQPAIPGESPPIVIPRRGSGPVGETPPPPEEAGQRAANLAGFSQGIARLKELLPSFINSKGGGRRLGQQVLRQAPMVGPQISERMSKEGEQVAAVLQRVKADFVRIMSGLQASETEQKRLAGTLPDIGTVDAATALSKIEEFENGIRAYAREKYRQRPSLFSPELIQELGLEGVEVAPRKSASERLDEILAGAP